MSSELGKRKFTDVTTCVSNVKVINLRPKFNNLKEWIADPSNVYIGRAGVVFIDRVRFPSQSSLWANPYKIGKDGTRNEVLLKFETYIRQKLNNDNFRKKLLELKGKNLGCWCVSRVCSHENHDIVCHGQILTKILDEYERDT